MISLTVILVLSNPASQAVVGDVRVQFLTPSLVRLEQRGPMGFEDRLTFTVVEREWPGATFERSESDGRVILSAEGCTVSVPTNARSLDGVRVLSRDGTVSYQATKVVPSPEFLPTPGNLSKSYVVADSPRIIPPAWGATPPPSDAAVDVALAATSGWDLRNNAPDLYVFVGKGSTYTDLRRDFLKLTGPIPLPPRFALGFIDSRYHPYSDKEALASIDEYRKRKIPLDVFVVDTDWRINGSHGYDVETKLFPDMGKFIREAHSRNVKLMFNDHPEPIAPTALDPKELEYRYKNLTHLMAMGLDSWWYDRNWSTSLHEPAPGLRKELWGQRLYTDIAARFQPEKRPFVMTNVQGIDNGFKRYAPQPAGHRYPIWWTGDTLSQWAFLKIGIVNGVDAGVESLLPYVNEDLGGHAGTPSSELYVRFLQFGCLSPITRVHCTRGNDRHPWAFGSEAEEIVTDYVNLRYRLLPTIYAAARRAYDDGTPILRRCDLEWPQYIPARDSSQYLLGDDILVAPISSSVNGDAAVIPASMFGSLPGSKGLKAEYFANESLAGKPAVVRQDANVSFEWLTGSPDPALPKDKFSARWTGSIGPMPQSGSYQFVLRADDGVKLWIDGKAVIDSWKPQDDPGIAGSVELEAGKRYPIRLEYNEISGGAACVLKWALPNEIKKDASRSLWIPPGQWEDAWTGKVVTGPAKIAVSSPIWHTPMYVRRGGIVLQTPEVQFTGSRPWDTIVLNAFTPSANSTVTRELYEDDGISPSYQNGSFSRTTITQARTGNTITLRIGPSRGTFKGKLEKQTWVARMHLMAGEKPKSIVVDGKPVTLGRQGSAGQMSAKIMRRSKGGRDSMPFGGAGASASASGGPVVEVTIPARRSAAVSTVTLNL